MIGLSAARSRGRLGGRPKTLNADKQQLAIQLYEAKKTSVKKICEMLDMDDEELLAEMKRSFLLSDERHQRIDDTLEELMLEVDRLISRIDEIEDESLED